MIFLNQRPQPRPPKGKAAPSTAGSRHTSAACENCHRKCVPPACSAAHNAAPQGARLRLSPAPKRITLTCFSAAPRRSRLPPAPPHLSLQSEVAAYCSISCKVRGPQRGGEGAGDAAQRSAHARSFARPLTASPPQVARLGLPACCYSGPVSPPAEAAAREPASEIKPPLRVLGKRSRSLASATRCASPAPPCPRPLGPAPCPDAVGGPPGGPFPHSDSPPTAHPPPAQPHPHHPLSPALPPKGQPATFARLLEPRAPSPVLPRDCHWTKPRLADDVSARARLPPAIVSPRDLAAPRLGHRAQGRRSAARGREGGGRARRVFQSCQFVFGQVRKLLTAPGGFPLPSVVSL